MARKTENTELARSLLKDMRKDSIKEEHRDLTGDIRKDIGIKIRKVRIKMGLTREALGNMVGCSSNKIAKIECGHVDITIDFLIEIASCLGMGLQITFRKVK